MVERTNLHKDDKSELHCMIIAKKKGEDMPILCHPSKDMFFLILRGSMKINIYDKKGKLEETMLYEPITRSQSYAKLIEKGTYYQMRPCSDVVYVEVNRGPFNKNTHNRYLDG